MPHSGDCEARRYGYDHQAVIRFFVYVLPLALVLLIVVSFINALSISTAKKNEMTVGMMGEPSTLNPIKQADASASTVGGAIFNGLLKYNENLDITPDLAESFTLSQTTTFFFRDENAALTGLLTLEAARPRWSVWNLVSVAMDGASLRLKLSEPGMESSRAIHKLFRADDLVPLQILRIESPQALPLAELRAAPLSAPAVRFWAGSSSAVEFTLLGQEADAKKWAQKNVSRWPGAESRVLETLPFLAEPEVRFLLRRDVRWHDGAPFTSADPAFTFRAITDEVVASPRKPDFDTILRVETPSPHEFVVIYRRPYSPALTSWMMSMLPAHLLDGKSQEWWVDHFDRAPIGTGPFKFDEWKTNEYIRVVRNPDYFDAPAPWLDAIVYRHLSDQLALRLAFETRQVDFWGVDPWAVSTFEKDERFDLFSMPGNSYSYVGWNLRRPPFDEELVRRALAHAVNVPEMVRFILYGHGTQSTGIFTPQMWFYDPNIKPIEYNKDTARKLLAEAGWVPGPDGILTRDSKRFSFTLITNSGNEIRRDIATLVQDDLREIGIEVKVETYEWAVFLRNFVNKGEFDAVVLGWALGLDYDQYQIWHSSQTNPEQLNMVGYKNPKVDRLLEDIRQEYSRPLILRLASDLQQTIYNDQPYLFLYVPESTTVLWKDTFRIRRPGPDGRWIDTPLEMTKAGWSYYSDYFYRPEFSKDLP
ncbi:MAG: hypothetical protein Fur0032_02220 [Terrimicrobiaceae bacterium]